MRSIRKRSSRSRPRCRCARRRSWASTWACTCRAVRSRSPMPRSRRSWPCSRSASPASRRWKAARWQPDDFVLLDLEGTSEGKPIDGAKASDYMTQVGARPPCAGVRRESRGHGGRRGQGVRHHLPRRLSGRGAARQADALFKVHVKEIKEKVVPALDDAFAADASEFETHRRAARRRALATRSGAGGVGAPRVRSKRRRRRGRQRRRSPCRPPWSSVRRTSFCTTSSRPSASRA